MSTFLDCSEISKYLIFAFKKFQVQSKNSKHCIIVVIITYYIFLFTNIFSVTEYFLLHRINTMAKTSNEP